MITHEERTKYAQQFQAMNPEDGFITGMRLLQIYILSVVFCGEDVASPHKILKIFRVSSFATLVIIVDSLYLGEQAQEEFTKFDLDSFTLSEIWFAWDRQIVSIYDNIECYPGPLPMSTKMDSWIWPSSPLLCT
jgi:hypothetical protein